MKIEKKKAGVILQYISILAGVVISLIYTPIMLKLLGQNEYGMYTMSSSAIAYLSVLNFGLGSSYIKFFIRSKKESENSGVQELNYTYIIILSVIGVISLIAGAFIIFFVPQFYSETITRQQIDAVRIMMAITLVDIAISFPSSVFDSYLLANEQFIAQKIFYIIKEFLKPGAIILILILGYKAIGMVSAILFAHIVISLLTAFYCIFKVKFRIKRTKIRRSYLLELFGYSSFIFINMLVNEVNWNVDKFLLGAFKGPAETAIYGVAAQIASYFRMFASAVSGVFIPRVHKMISDNCDKGSLNELFIRIGRIQFYVLALIGSGFIFMGKAFLELWSGEEYISAYPITLLLIIPTIIPLIQNIGVEIQRAMNLHKFRAICYSAIAVMNVLLTIPLCNAYGGVGAAAATAVSVIIGNGIIMNLYYSKKVNIDIKKFWVSIIKILPALIIPICFGVAVSRLIDMTRIFSFAAFAIAYTLIYIVSVYFIAMNKDEKRILNKMLRIVKIGRKNV